MSQQTNPENQAGATASKPTTQAASGPTAAASTAAIGSRSIWRTADLHRRLSSEAAA